MSALPFAATTPVHVARVGIKAHDAEKLARFYREVVGLQELGRTGETIRLGAGSRELVEIEASPGARADDPRSAGLFHTAFLLPERADLARWLRFAAEKKLPISGASDHLVSEAIYLDDPEGNGIEIYADRPQEQWPWKGSEVEMATLRLDAESLLTSVPEGGAAWQGAPDNTVIGHVHLRVGDAARAEHWWRETLGLHAVAHYGKDAVFMSSGGYHHHIGANTWRSSGAGPRDQSRAGLSWVELNSRDAGEARELSDPWGTAIRVVPGSG